MNGAKQFGPSGHERERPMSDNETQRRIDEHLAKIRERIQNTPPSDEAIFRANHGVEHVLPQHSPPQKPLRERRAAKPSNKGHSSGSPKPLRNPPVEHFVDHENPELVRDGDGWRQKDLI
jgi:hypothetical protein